MSNLRIFLRKYSYYMLFVLLLVIGMVQLVSYNPFQKSSYARVSLLVSGEVFALTSRIQRYLWLDHTNQTLIERNQALEQELYILRQKWRMASYDSVEFSDNNLPEYPYETYQARVINNSIRLGENFITLNQGSNSGIQPEMGVIDHRGVVGVVVSTSEHFSLVISVLNTKIRFSGKLKNSQYVGSLVWYGESPLYSYLEEIPRNVLFNKGDTVVTSGFSSIFPADLMIGVVEDYTKQKDDNFYSIKVRLSTDFNALDRVRVLSFNSREEQSKLENSLSTNPAK